MGCIDKVGGGVVLKRRWSAGAAGAVTSVALALIGVALLVLGIDDQEPRPLVVPAAGTGLDLPGGRPARPTPPPPSTPASTPAEDTADRIDGPVLPHADPVALRIPEIEVATPLVALGLDAAGAMVTPADPGEAGWYTLAPAPGSLGPAVIAGHVTWDGDPGVFFRLGELRRGDRVEVRRAGGRTAVFAVVRVERFAKSRFPTGAVFGPTDHAALRLITCGGRYDQDRASYDDNVVVFADLVVVRRPRPAGAGD